MNIKFNLTDKKKSLTTVKIWYKVSNILIGDTNSDNKTEREEKNKRE
jgi:hypothetical protein